MAKGKVARRGAERKPKSQAPMPPDFYPTTLEESAAFTRKLRAMFAKHRREENRRALLAETAVLANKLVRESDEQLRASGFALDVVRYYFESGDSKLLAALDAGLRKLGKPVYEKCRVWPTARRSAGPEKDLRLALSKAIPLAANWKRGKEETCLLIYRQVLPDVRRILEKHFVGGATDLALVVEIYLRARDERDPTPAVLRAWGAAEHVQERAAKRAGLPEGIVRERGSDP